MAAALLIFSAGAQNITYGFALGAARSEFAGVVLAMASAGATLLAPVCFAAVVVCWRRRTFGVSLVALVLGVLALAYASTCSLGTVAGSRDVAISEHLQAGEAAKDRRALIETTRAELATLKGTRADILERRAELTAILVEQSRAKAGKGTAVRPDSQAAGVAFVLGALGWSVSIGDVGQWLNILTVLFLELAAALSLTVAAALYPPTRRKPSEGVYSAVPASGTSDTPETESAAVRPSGEAAGGTPEKVPDKGTRKGDDDPPPRPPKGRGGRKPTVIPEAAVAKLREKGGKVSGSMNGVGRLLGTRSKTATHRLLHRLAGAGLVQLGTSPAGVSVAVTG
jgi:hypothetical protein